MGFSEAPVVLRVALVILTTAIVLNYMGLGTAHWSELTVNKSSSSLGLWRVCGPLRGRESKCGQYPDDLVEDWLRACRTFGFIGILTMLVAAVSLIFCTSWCSKDPNMVCNIFTAIAAFGGTVFALVAVIIWAAKNSDDYYIGGTSTSSKVTNSLSWSFGLSIAGAILSAIGGASVALFTFQTEFR